MKIEATEEEITSRAIKCANECYDYNFPSVGKALDHIEVIMPELAKKEIFTEAFKAEWKKLLELFDE